MGVSFRFLGEGFPGEKILGKRGIGRFVDCLQRNSKLALFLFGGL
jgi:hypothetical protein